MPIFLAIVGIVLVVYGTALLSYPAALIVAGLILIRVAQTLLAPTPRADI